MTCIPIERAGLRLLAEQATGVLETLRPQALQVLNAAIDREGSHGQVVFVLDHGTQLARELGELYLLPEYRLAEQTVEGVLVVAVHLAGAVHTLRAPLHLGNRGMFAELEKRALSLEQLQSGRHLCICIAGMGCALAELSPARGLLS